MLNKAAKQFAYSAILCVNRRFMTSFSLFSLFDMLQRIRLIVFAVMRMLVL